MRLLASVLRDYGQSALSIGLLIAMVIGSIGVLYLSGPGRQPVMTPEDTKRLAVTPAVSVKTTEAHRVSKPVRMLLPSVDLGLDIDDATIDPATNTWPLSDTTAQYANFTPGLGSAEGTMLLYGHNSWPVLRKSNDLQLGDELILIDNNNRRWHFVLSSVTNITPEQVGFIYEESPFRVVIFTCNGWGDEYRRLMYFNPVE